MTMQTPTPNYNSGGGGSDPASMVSMPGVVLMIIGIVYVIGSLLFTILEVAGVGIGMAGGGNGVDTIINGAGGIISGILGFLFGFVIAFGGMKMRQLRGYGVAMAGAVLAMLPCTCCCIVGLPVGIWALIVLMKPEVKAAFK
jgi:hypothetical protein